MELLNDIERTILGDRACEWRHKHTSATTIPHCEIGARLICSPSNTLDGLARARIEHEAGHALLTPTDIPEAWSPLKRSLVNALEDLRIERGVSRLSKDYENDLKALNDHIIGKMQRHFKSGLLKGAIKATSEAILAMLFTENGHEPQWDMTPEARRLFSSAMDIFSEWRNADCDTPAGFKAMEDIADRIIARWNNEKSI